MNQLVAKTNKIAIKKGEHIAITDLVEVTGWRLAELSIGSYWTKLEYMWSYEDERYDERYISGFTGQETGSDTIFFRTPDGEEVQIDVTVKFNAAASASKAWDGIVWFFKDGLTGNWVFGQPDTWLEALRNIVLNIPVLLALPFFLVATTLLLLYYY